MIWGLPDGRVSLTVHRALKKVALQCFMAGNIFLPELTIRDNQAI